MKKDILLKIQETCKKFLVTTPKRWTTLEKEYNLLRALSAQSENLMLIQALRNSFETWIQSDTISKLIVPLEVNTIVNELLEDIEENDKKSSIPNTSGSKKPNPPSSDNKLSDNKKKKSQIIRQNR